MAVARYDRSFSGRTQFVKKHLNRVADAIICRTDYGARIDFSDGRVTALWAFALDEPVMEVALRRVQRSGAKYILIEPEPEASI